MTIRYLILIIFVFSFSTSALAQGFQEPEELVVPEKLNKVYEQIDEKALQPMKQLSEKLSENIEKTLEKVIEKIKQKKHQKQEEVKEEIKREAKEEAREWGQGLAIWIEDQLAPLKIKIQEGSSLIREKVYQIKDWLIDLF